LGLLSLFGILELFDVCLDSRLVLVGWSYLAPSIGHLEPRALFGIWAPPRSVHTAAHSLCWFGMLYLVRRVVCGFR